MQQSKSSCLWLERPWPPNWLSLLILRPAFHTKHHFTVRTPSPCHPAPLAPDPGPFFTCSGISHPGNPGHCSTLISPSLLRCLMPTFPGNPGFWEQLQLLSLLAAAAQKQGSMVQRCFLSGLIFFYLFILKNLVGWCQLWAQCQLPPVCPWSFCLGTLCTQAPAESDSRLQSSDSFW